MENTQNITDIIIQTINTIFETIFSSIDNNLFLILDDIVFVSSDILEDPYFEKILGTSASNGILLITNSLLFGLLYIFQLNIYFHILHIHK